MDINKKMLLMDEDMVDTVDAQRGELSRAEFIDYCISNLFGEEEDIEGPGVRTENYRPRRKPQPLMNGNSASQVREELLTLRRDIQKMVKRLLELFIDFNLDRGSHGKMDTHELVELREQVNAALGGAISIRRELEELKKSIRTIEARTTGETVSRSQLEEYKAAIEAHIAKVLEDYITRSEFKNYRSSVRANI